MLGSFFQNKAGRIAAAAIAILFIMSGAAAILILKSGSRSSERLPAPAPLAQGRQVYTITTGGTGPKITEVVVDPFDPKKGDWQSMEVTTSASELLESAAITLITDHRSSSYELVRATSTAANASVWRGVWKVEDTHMRTYSAVVRAVAASGASSTIELSFR